MSNKYYGLNEQPTNAIKEDIPDWMEKALLSINNEKKENPFKGCDNFYMKEFENKKTQ